MSRASSFEPRRDGASKDTFAFLFGTSMAPARVIVDRSNAPSWGTWTLPVNDAVNSNVLTSARDVTPLVTMSFGSVRAGAAAGVGEQAPTSIAAIATRRSGSAPRRVVMNGSPMRGVEGARSLPKVGVAVNRGGRQAGRTKKA